MPTEGWEGDIGNHDWGGFVSAQAPDPASGLLSQEASIRAAADAALSVRIDGVSGEITSGIALLSVPNTFTEVNKIPGLRVGTVAVFNDYTMTSTDFEVLVDANGGPITVTLPPSTGSGQYYRVKKIDASDNIVTVAADGSDLIDDSILVALQDQWSDCTLIDAATGYWDNVGSSGGTEGGSVTSTELQSVESRLSVRIDNVSTTGGASVTSAEVVNLVQIASAAAVSADIHASNASAAATSANAHANTASAAATAADTHAATASAAATSADAHANVVSARLVSVSAEVMSFLTSASATLEAHINAVSAAGVTGGASVTSQEISVLVQIASAAATSADTHANTISARVVSASAELASLVQIASAAATSADSHANIASAAATSVAALVNTASAAATSADAHAAAASAAATSADAHANTVSIAANAVSARLVSASAELASLVQIASAAATSADGHANTVSGRLVSVSAELNSLLASVEGRLSTRIDTASGTGGGGGYWTSTVQVSASNFLTSSTTLVDITGLTYSATTSSLYEIQTVLRGQSDSTAGVRFGIAFSGAGATGETILLANLNQSMNNNGYDAQSINAEVIASKWTQANADGLAFINAVVATGANTGNITTQIRKVTSGQLTVYIGSIMKIRKLA